MANILAAIVAALLGLAFLVYGYRLFLVMLPIWGFFAGFWLGAQTVALIFGSGFLADVTGLVVGFVAGLVFAILSYLFYALGVGVIAAAFGATVASGIMQWLGFEPGLILGLVALGGALLAVVVTFLFQIQKYVIIAITAVGGANAIVMSVLLLFGSVTLNELSGAGNTIRPLLQESWIWLAVWLGLAVVGFLAQLRTSRDFAFSKRRYVEGWG